MKYKLPVVVLSGLLLSVPVSLLRANDEMTGAGMEAKEHHWDAQKMQKDLGLTDDQVTQLNKSGTTKKPP